MKKISLLLCVGIVLATAQARAAAPLVDLPFKITSQQFEAGDSIVVQQMLASSPELKIGDTVLVRGNYQLKSASGASLGLHLTTKGPSAPTPITSLQQVEVAAGTGLFELSEIIAADGSLHVSFYPLPHGPSFGGVYFAPPKP